MYNTIIFFTVLKEELIEKDKVLLSQYTANVSYIQEKILGISHSLILDQEMQHYLKEYSKSNDLFIENRIEEKLVSTVTFADFIHSAIIVVVDGKNISQRTYPGGDDIQRNMNLDINYQKERYFFSDPFTARTIRGTVDFVSFVHIFPDIEVISNILGHLVINIDHDLLEKELNTGGSDDFDALVILNKNKKVIMQKGEPIDLSVFTFGDDNFVESSQGFAYINENLYDDWTVIAYKSYESVYSRLQYIYLFVIITILSSIAVIIFINTSIIASITKPITKLTNAMKKK